MFLKQQPLKKMMEAAYKGNGLIVANKGEDIYIAGGYWAIDIKRKHLPKTILAKIIELAGELPEVGECFEATKAGNQMLAGGIYEINAEYEPQLLKISRVITISCNGIPQRILQNALGENVLISEDVLGAVCRTAINTDKGEGEPAGPFYVESKGLFWWNNVMKFRVNYRTVENEDSELIRSLERIKLW